MMLQGSGTASSCGSKKGGRSQHREPKQYVTARPASQCAMAGPRGSHHHSVCARQPTPCPAQRCITRACSKDSQAVHQLADASSRRELLQTVAGIVLTSSLSSASPAAAVGYSGLDYKQELARRRRKIPIEEFSDGPQGLKYYDIVSGAGAEAKVGQRVAVHYDVKFRNVTFITSRQGLGVTGGTPVGFNVGTPKGEAGSTLPGIDLGIRGMRVGGLRRLLVPPELAYGSKGVGEIPPNATLTVDVELLSIKTSALGYRTKLVEG